MRLCVGCGDRLRWWDRNPTCSLECTKAAVRQKMQAEIEDLALSLTLTVAEAIGVSKEERDAFVAELQEERRKERA